MVSSSSSFIRALAAGFAAAYALTAGTADGQPVKGAGPAPAPRASSDATGAPPSPLPSCQLRGVIPMGKGVEIWDAAVGGNAIGKFSGASTPLFVAHLPADPKAQRARVATSIGLGDPTVRVEGWAMASTIPLFSTRDLPAGSHVSIARSHRVELLRVAPDGLEVQLAIAGTSGQTVRAKVPCDALAVSPPPTAAGPAAAGGTQWVSKGGSIDILDTPNGSVVFSLRLDGANAQTFWSTEQRGNFLRVESRSDVVLTGWIRVSDVQRVKAGEVRAKYVPPQVPAGSIVRLPENPPLARVLREATLHADAERTARVIGAVEPGAEVYVLATIAGYVSVLPKNLGVVAADRKGFWVAAAEVQR